tara:strand:+ start:1066 stop:1374 length:309 start_codon:yes stop_codon:yes gene_type:complete
LKLIANHTFGRMTNTIHTKYNFIDIRAPFSILSSPIVLACDFNHHADNGQITKCPELANITIIATIKKYLSFRKFSPKFIKKINENKVIPNPMIIGIPNPNQ